jgi:hypothetical protein
MPSSSSFTNEEEEDTCISYKAYEEEDTCQLPRLSLVRRRRIHAYHIKRMRRRIHASFLVFHY